MSFGRASIKASKNTCSDPIVQMYAGCEQKMRLCKRKFFETELFGDG
jgi:hypothetical protein